MLFTFIGREKELTSLDAFYKKKESGFVVIKSRRRIEKSCLVMQFTSSKKDQIVNTSLPKKQLLDISNNRNKNTHIWFLDGLLFFMKQS